MTLASIGKVFKVFQIEYLGLIFDNFFLSMKHIDI